MLVMNVKFVLKSVFSSLLACIMVSVVSAENSSNSKIYNASMFATQSIANTNTNINAKKGLQGSKASQKKTLDDHAVANKHAFHLAKNLTISPIHVDAQVAQIKKSEMDVNKNLKTYFARVTKIAKALPDDQAAIIYALYKQGDQLNLMLKTQLILIQQNQAIIDLLSKNN